jgi:23S rRNA pseudouridine1911/1915/1917 synthase
MKTGKKIILEVPRQLVDKRLDVAALVLIRKKYPGNQLSRGAITRLIKAKQITLNNTPAQASHFVSLHDKIEIFESDLVISEPKLETRDITIPILYEDDFLIAIDKPAGIQTHPAGDIKRDTVAHFIVSKYPKLRNIGENPLRPGIVHRLDRETSGVLVVAKTGETFEELKKLFQDRKIEKTYIALVYGHTPKLEGVIDKSLLQQSGKLKRVAITTQLVPSAAREALTLYRTVARYQDFDLLLVTPKTGRTHQIRAHLADLGHPIVGDKLYAFKNIRREKKLFPSRQMLHAFRLQFELFAKKYAFQAPLPDDFRSLLRRVDETKETSYDDETLRSLLE